MQFVDLVEYNERNKLKTQSFQDTENISLQNGEGK